MGKKYLDNKYSIDERVSDLLGRMTIEEKIGQMMQLSALDDGCEAYIEQYHIGAYLHALGEKIHQLNALSRAQSRLQIPLIFGIDAIHGHCFESGATVFPSQLGMACTWNRDLIEEMGCITAGEVRAGGLHWTFSPVLCLARDPRWGRTGETFGEDPVLAASLAEALSKGYQTAPYPIAACAKHFAAYGETDGGRDSAEAHVSIRRMRTVFLPPFKRQAECGCMTFMAAYQSLNGVPCSANTWLLNDVLREEWGYTGVVVTDWNNAGQIATLQCAASSLKEAVFQCLSASNDIFMSTPGFFEEALALVKEGRVSTARIDQSVTRVLALKFRLGLFDNYPVPDRIELLGSAARWEPALEASRQSLTLVKNSGVLPLQNIKRILLVGENADNVVNQLGDWSFVPGSSVLNDEQIHRADTVTLREALDTFCEEREIALDFFGAEVIGPELNSSPDLEALTQAAACADIVIFVAGEALKQYGEFHDRADLNLTGNQQQVFDALCRCGTPIVFILVASRPHTIETVLEKSDAVVIAFNPGAKGGRAIQELLFGEINPSGRLPISFPRHVGQLPIYYNQAPGWHAPLSHHYDARARYIDLEEGPLLAFGQGMSYSDIAYGKATLNANTVTSNAPVVLSLTIENRSDRDAVEVVQLYIRVIIPGVTTPRKQLLKFERAMVPAGLWTTVRFELARSDFEIWDKHLEQHLYEGEVVLMVGRSSRTSDLQSLILKSIGK